MQTGKRNVFSPQIGAWNSVHSIVARHPTKFSDHEFLRVIFSLIAARSGFIALLALVIVGGATRSSAQQGDHASSFEVVSIHRDPDTSNMSMGVTETTWFAKGAPATTLIWTAFDLKAFQVLNAPKWIDSEKFAIQAKFPDDFLKLSENEQRKQFGLLVISMLQERFHLRYHWTTRVYPVYSLMLAKGGLKIQKSLPSEAYKAIIKRDFIEAHAIGMGDFANQLGLNLNHLVEDRTNLSSRYSFTLRYPPLLDGSEINVVSLDSPVESEARLFSALSEQLGLRLVPEKRPVRMLVIEDMEMPTPN